MKHCTRCNDDKPLGDFAQNRSKKDGLQPWCRKCFKVYDDARYAKRGPGTWRSQVMEGNKRDKARRQQWLLDYLAEHPCVDCGESDPIVLEFDHVRETKSFNVSRLFYSAGWRRVLAEIAKCDVRCANCHKRRTAKQFGWYSAVKEPLVGNALPLLPGGGL